LSEKTQQSGVLTTSGITHPRDPGTPASPFTGQENRVPVLFRSAGLDNHQGNIIKLWRCAAEREYGADNLIRKFLR